MNARHRRVGLVVMLAGVLGIGFTRPAAAAAPWITMVSGDDLAQPRFITGFDRNLQLLLALNTSVDPASLRDRLHLTLALFWGDAWRDYLQQGKPLSALRTADAWQLGEYYPATGSEPAVINLHGSGRGPLIVDAAGLAILRQYGVPTTAAHSSGTVLPDSGAPRPAAILAFSTFLLALAALVIGWRLRVSTGAW